jgi:hypothetical protein
VCAVNQTKKEKGLTKKRKINLGTALVGLKKIQ